MELGGFATGATGSVAAVYGMAPVLRGSQILPRHQRAYDASGQDQPDRRVSKRLVVLLVFGLSWLTGRRQRPVFRKDWGG